MVRLFRRGRRDFPLLGFFPGSGRGNSLFAGADFPQCHGFRPVPAASGKNSLFAGNIRELAAPGAAAPGIA
jgi:hypothetical protein